MSDALRPSDSAVTLAGIRQFGLAADGSDLRDIERAITSLSAEVERLRGENARLRRETENCCFYDDIVAERDRLRTALVALCDELPVGMTLVFGGVVQDHTGINAAKEQARAALSSSPASEPVSDAWAKWIALFAAGKFTCGAKYICFLPEGGDDKSYRRLAQAPRHLEDQPEWELFAKALVAQLNALHRRYSPITDNQKCSHGITPDLCSICPPASPASLDVRAQVIEECAKVAEGRKPATQDHISDLLAEQSDYIATAIRALATTPPAPHKSLSDYTLGELRNEIYSRAHAALCDAVADHVSLTAKESQGGE